MAHQDQHPLEDAKDVFEYIYEYDRKGTYLVSRGLHVCRYHLLTTIEITDGGEAGEGDASDETDRTARIMAATKTSATSTSKSSALYVSGPNIRGILSGSYVGFLYILKGTV